MKKKSIIVFLLVFIFLLFGSYFLARYYYLQTVQKNVSIKYFLPSAEALDDHRPFGRVVFSFKHPIPKDYFLKNFNSLPKIEGEFIFKKSADSLIVPIGYKEIEFLPKEIKRDELYQIKIFEKEFTFSVPSPKVQKMEFDPEKKEMEIVFFEPVTEDYFLKNFRTEPVLQGDYYFLDGNRRVVFRLGSIEEDKDYIAKISDKDISFKVESARVKNFVFNDHLKQLEIHFTKPISEESFFQNFKLSVPLEGNYSFDNENKRVIFKINNLTENYLYGVEMLGEKFSFRSESVRVSRLYFDNSRRQVIVTFTKPIESAVFFNGFNISPHLEGKSSFNSQRTQVVFVPNNIKEDQQYTVSILEKTITFKYTPPAPLPAISGEKYIDINLSTQRLRLYQGGVMIAEYVISSGKPGMATPTGTFRILSKETNRWSNQYSLYMPYAMRFYGGYFIHELPYWPGGYREGEHHLGIPVSHGCVRLGIGPAAAVFNFAGIGTPVVIHY